MLSSGISIEELKKKNYSVIRVTGSILDWNVLYQY